MAEIGVVASAGPELANARRGAESAPPLEGGVPPGETRQTYPVLFTGRAGEYFRIWIVNLALTIVTFGVYSAWAKVRKRRYLYGHTRVADEGFEYRAKPLPILIGRLIALAGLAAIIAADALVPALAANPLLRRLEFLVVLAIAGPWIVVRSLRFNARNTAYRNIRFRFAGRYVDGLKIVGVYCWLPLFPIAYPRFKRRVVEFGAENHFYGETRFSLLDAFRTPFVNAYAIAYGWAFLVLLLYAIGVAYYASIHVKWAIVPLALALYVGFGLGIAFIRARTVNAIWNNLRVGGVRFTSSLRARDLIALYASNVVVLVLTLGLATPWAVVRVHRYRASKTTMIASGSLDEFVQAEDDHVGAAGEEIGEMLDFDISL